MSEQRKELMYDRNRLPSGYWEPQPDEDDLERMRKEYEEAHKCDDEKLEELPFD